LDETESKALNSRDPSWNGAHELAVLNFSPPR
jgi:hypothetical protein